MLSSNKIDILLASIDPSLLELPPQIEGSEGESEEEGDVTDTDAIDPELLKELTELNASSRDAAETKVIVVPEDPELMRELAALTKSDDSDYQKIEAPKFSEQQLKQRQFDLKKAALLSKKKSDLSTAKRLMGEAKRLDEAIILVSSGLPLESDFVLPDIPKIPKTSIPPQVFPPEPKKVLILDSTRDNAIRVPPQPTLADQFDSLAIKLEAQADLAGQLAKQFFRLGDRSNALRFQRYRKGFQAQMEQVESSRLQLQPSIPLTRTEVVTFSLPQEELDVAPNVLELWFGRAWGLTHPQLGIKQPDSYVQYSLGFNNNSGYSPVSYQSADPNYAFTARLGVDGSRAWQRHAERKALVIEVLHYRGFLFQAWSLGKASIPLAPLLKRPSFEQIVELIHPTSRRPTGARIEVRIKMRRPILAQPAQQTQQEWLVVLPPVGAPPRQPSPVEAPPRQPSPVSPILPNLEVEIVSAKETIKEQKNSVQERADLHSETKLEDEQESALEEYFSTSRLVAKTVLELESERLSTGSELTPLPEDWDIVARLAELDLKLNLLEVQAQLGQLDPNIYLGQLYASLAAHKALALRLKKVHLLAHARQVLIHIKAIQTEIDELVSMGFSAP